MDGDATDLAADDFDLAHVDTGANLDAERFDALRDVKGELDRQGRGLERRVYAVAGRIDLATAEPMERASDDPQMALEQSLPTFIAQPSGDLGGAGDVGEDDSRKVARAATPGSEHDPSAEGGPRGLPRSRDDDRSTGWPRAHSTGRRSRIDD